MRIVNNKKATDTPKHKRFSWDWATKEWTQLASPSPHRQRATGGI